MTASIWRCSAAPSVPTTVTLWVVPMVGPEKVSEPARAGSAWSSAGGRGHMFHALSATKATSMSGSRIFALLPYFSLFHDGHGTYDVLVEVPPAPR